MWGSIEWILPACKYLKDNHDGIELLFLIQRRRKKEIFRDNSELEMLVNEFSTQRCLDLSDISPVWIRSISDLFYFLEEKWPGWLFSKIGNFWFNRNWIFFGKRICKKWIRRLRPDICLMDSHRNELFRELKKTGINIGYLMYSDSPFDFFLVDTKWAANFFKSIAQKRPVLQVGCPKFDTSWIDYLKNKFNCSSDQVRNSNCKRSILILLANESSFIFNSISFEDMLNEIIHACTKIKNIRLTIKPHPRQDIYLLKRIINRYHTMDIEISNKPSFVLINNAQLIIAMPSGVIIDVIILGRPVIEYFNYVKLNKILKEEFGQIPKGALGGMGYLNKKGHLSSVFRELGFVLTADNQDELEFAVQKMFSNNNYLAEKKDIRSIFPENASKKTAEAVMSLKDV